MRWDADRRRTAPRTRSSTATPWQRDAGRRAGLGAPRRVDASTTRQPLVPDQIADYVRVDELGRARSTAPARDALLAAVTACWTSGPMPTDVPVHALMTLTARD